MAAAVSELPLVFAGWARIWSPLVDDAARGEAWQALALPGDPAALAGDFLSAFHVGLPQPTVTLLLHAALARDGGAVREELVRVMDYLGADYTPEGRLPPDHLACICELAALAHEAEEPVLVSGLSERYLAPWVELAAPRLAGYPALAAVVAAFAEDLQRPAA